MDVSTAAPDSFVAIDKDIKQAHRRNPSKAADHERKKASDKQAVDESNLKCGSWGQKEIDCSRDGAGQQRKNSHIVGIPLSGYG